MSPRVERSADGAGGPPADSGAPAPAPRAPASWTRWCGIALVGLSFALYGGLALVPWLSWSLEGKVGLSSLLVILGEVSFWIGGLILGKQVIARYRRVLDPRWWLRASKRLGDRSEPRS